MRIIIEVPDRGRPETIVMKLLSGILNSDLHHGRIGWRSKNFHIASSAEMSCEGNPRTTGMNGFPPGQE